MLQFKTTTIVNIAIMYRLFYKVLRIFQKIYQYYKSLIFIRILVS